MIFNEISRKMNIRRTLLSVLLVAVCATVFAVPAKRGLWKTITLTDGTTVEAQLVGDERMHYYVDAAGNCYSQEGETELFVATDIAALTAAKSSRRAARMRRVGGVSNGYYGTKKGLIILTNFSDKEFLDGHDQALYERIANEKGFTSDDGFQGSVADFFSDQSGGVFELDFDVVGPITLSNTYSYYGKNDSYGDDARAGEMVAEALLAVDDSVDFSLYDWSGDGEVEQVFILYAGLGEAAGGSSNTIWPHMWDLYSSDYGKTLTLDGVVLNTYACSCELTMDYTTLKSRIDGIGTICHEFSHCLGYPDVYDTSGYNFGMATWSILDYGCYNGDAFVPSGYTSYEKWVAGWLEPIELSSDTVITDMKALSDGGEAYIIYNDMNEDEFYLIENRQLTGWDASQYGSGVLILHIDYDYSAWYNNTVNTVSTHQRYTIFHADNSDGDMYDANGEVDISRDPYPYNGNDSLTDSSTPAATIFTANSTGTKYMGVSITDISIDDDGNASFVFGAVTAEEESGTTLFRETFNDCSGKGGNDGSWSGNIASATFKSDMDGWTYNYGYGGDACARFGNSKNGGEAVSPTFDIDGTATLTLVAAPWGTSSTTLVVAFNGEEIGSYDLTPQQWNTLTATLNGSGTGYMEFTSSARFFIDDVKVVLPDDDATGITTVETNEKSAADSRVYSIDGRYLGDDISALGRGIYIVGGRKVVK